MAVYLVKGARNNVIGDVADAGPFEVYLNNEAPSARAGQPGVDLLVHNLYDDTDSYLEDITVDGITYTDVVSKDNLNNGVGLTTSISGPQFIFRSVSNCTNGFTYIPPSPTPTPSVTPSLTPSTTPTISVTPSVTPSVTATVTPTISITPTISVTPSITPTKTVSISTTPSISITPTSTPSISTTPSISITPSISVTPGVSPTRTPSRTPPNSPSRTPSNTPPNSPPNSVTPSPTPSISISNTPSISITPSITPSTSPGPIRYQDLVWNVGAADCDDACPLEESTEVWYEGASLTNGTVLYTSATGTGTIDTGYFGYEGDECWYYGAAAYLQALCCVIEGTQISTSPSSSVAVETLEIGDAVLSRHISSLPDSNDGQHELSQWRADNIVGNSSTALVVSNETKIVTSIYNFNDGALKTTGTHQHIIKRDGLWRVVKAYEVTVGDIFLDKEGNEINITSAIIENSDVRIYKLNVETDDVYYANGILTHNVK